MKTSLLSTVIAVALAGGMSLAQASFAVEALPQGYQLASAEKAGEGKCGEGKCGEGKCGTSEAGAKVSQAEGKCGEGKCGDESFARTDSDDDHLVSLAEFLTVAPTSQVEFEEMDTNGDGYPRYAARGGMNALAKHRIWLSVATTAALPVAILSLVMLMVVPIMVWNIRNARKEMS